MPISDREREAITALAREAGHDEQETAAILEAADEADEPADPGAKERPGTPDKEAAPTEIRVFQYHLPFLTVEEIRGLIGFTAAVPDGGMLAGEWLVKHGGALGGKGSAPPETPPAATE